MVGLVKALLDHFSRLVQDFLWEQEAKQRYPDYFSEGYLTLEQYYFCDVGSVESIICPRKSSQEMVRKTSFSLTGPTGSFTKWPQPTFPSEPPIHPIFFIL